MNNGFLLPRDFGIDVRVVSVDTAARSAQFQWKLSTQRTFNAEVTVTPSQYADRSRAYHLTTDYNGDGVVDMSGLFVYWSVTDADFNFPPSTPSTQTIFPNDRYFLNVTYNQGKGALLVDQNTLHPSIECAGRGICDRVKGECQCFAGYTGDACQRTTCPNACSGHGTCQNLKNFVEDGTNGVNSYAGVDATQMMGCKCDPGYRGGDCSLVECPSGPDPMGGAGGAQGQDCSGRGLCDYTSGQCQCFKGFAGASRDDGHMSGVDGWLAGCVRSCAPNRTLPPLRSPLPFPLPLPPSPPAAGERCESATTLI